MHFFHQILSNVESPLCKIENHEFSLESNVTPIIIASYIFILFVVGKYRFDAGIVVIDRCTSRQFDRIIYILIKEACVRGKQIEMQ